MKDQHNSRNKMLSVKFTELLGPVEGIDGVKSVEVDDNNGGSFQMAVVLNMENVGTGWDWGSAYGFSDARKRLILRRVVREVKKAFRGIEGCTVTAHQSPEMQYDYWNDGWQARATAHRMGYNGRLLMVDCHWYPENERVSIQELVGA